MAQQVFKNPNEIVKNLIKDEDISFLQDWLSDKGSLPSHRWKFDADQRTAWKDIAPYNEEQFNELKSEQDPYITKWLKEHGFTYELTKGDYDWETKGHVGRNWVNTDKGNKKTTKNRMLLNIKW